MAKYICLNPIADIGLNLFSSEYEAVDDMQAADAALVRSASLHDMELPENLKAIARAGAGVNNIPLEECAKRGIVVFNTPGANANGVKELVLAGMLLASRDIIGGVNWVQSERQNEDIAKQAEKEKKNFAGCELNGKKLGIIGLGAIGVLVANAATHLGMEVYGYDPYISVEAAWNLSRSIKHIQDVNDIYRECDYITIHVPLLENTKQMINKEAISLMKEGVVVLNFSRDLLVEEQDMVVALKEGKVKRYVTDFPNPITAAEKHCIVIPHLGASTEESEDNCAVMAVKELKDFLQNGNIKNSVNYPNCDMGVCEAGTRITINHRNIKNMLSQITAIFGNADRNIVNMVNKSRGEYAYSMFDCEKQITEDIAVKVAEIDGVLKVRIIK